MKVAALIALTLTAMGAGWKAFHASGVSIRFPPDWYATATALTPVTSPQQVLAVASYRLPATDRGANGCEPRQALQQMPTGGAFIYGWSYGDAVPRSRVREFPVRPTRFALRHLVLDGCLGRSYRSRFRLHGQFFQIYVVLGQRATRATRTTVTRILDSFTVSR